MKMKENKDKRIDGRKAKKKGGGGSTKEKWKTKENRVKNKVFAFSLPCKDLTLAWQFYNKVRLL